MPHPFGFYESENSDVVDFHIKSMDHAKIDLAISSWWGQSHKTDKNLKLNLDRTESLKSDLKWVAFYEQEGKGKNPSPGQIRNDLDYLRSKYVSRNAYGRINGKPVIFVWNEGDKDCNTADRWAAAGAFNDWYVVLKYWGRAAFKCAKQPGAWYEYGRSANGTLIKSDQRKHSFLVCPGFKMADGSREKEWQHRNPAEWRKAIRRMVNSGADFQVITSFNEWGEGTAIENAKQWNSASGYGTYLDILACDGNC